MAGYVTREEWLARKPRSVSTNVRKGRIKLHWTVTCMRASSSLREEERHMRGLQGFHMDERGYSDIAYNWVVFPSGRIYEGRGFGVRSAANGNGYLNYQHQAMAFVAGPTCGPTDLQFEAAGTFIAVHYPHDVKGHRDGYSTTCPGDEIYKWVQDEGWEDSLRNKGPSYWTWRAWKCGIGPWEGKGQKDAGARYRPRIPGRASPKWPRWWAKFAASGGCRD